MRQIPPGPQRLGAGDALRFCVSDSDGLRSNVWSVVGGRRADEVYLAARDVMGSAKLSIHHTGRWRWAMTSAEAARRQLPPEQDRVILRWEPPAPVAPGWMRAATVSIPWSSMRALAPEKPPSRGIISHWSPDPGPREVCFDIFIKSPDADELTISNITELVGRIDLPSGGAIWVVGTEWVVTHEREPQIVELRHRTRSWHIERSGAESFKKMTQPTGTAWYRDADDGRPVVIDLGDLRASTDRQSDG